MNTRFISKVLVLAMLAACLVIFSGCLDEPLPAPVNAVDLMIETPSDTKKSEAPVNDDDKAEGTGEAENADDNKDVENAGNAEGNGNAEDNGNSGEPSNNNSGSGGYTCEGANTEEGWSVLYPAF